MFPGSVSEEGKKFEAKLDEQIERSKHACSRCGHINPPEAAQCESCLQKLASCSVCSKAVGGLDKFCRNCGTNLKPICKNCNAPLQPTDKFCPDCGHPVNPAGS